MESLSFKLDGWGGSLKMGYISKDLKEMREISHVVEEWSGRRNRGG